MNFSARCVKWLHNYIAYFVSLHACVLLIQRIANKDDEDQNDQRPADAFLGNDIQYYHNYYLCPHRHAINWLQTGGCHVQSIKALCIQAANRSSLIRMSLYTSWSVNGRRRRLQTTATDAFNSGNGNDSISVDRCIGLVWTSPVSTLSAGFLPTITDGSLAARAEAREAQTRSPNVWLCSWRLAPTVFCGGTTPGYRDQHLTYRTFLGVRFG